MARIKRKNGLLPKQNKLIQKLSEGLNLNDASKSVGYNPDYASTLLRKANMAKALEAVGLTDRSIAEGIKTNVQAGMGVKATASDSLRGLELASKLKGHLEPEQRSTPESLSQTNIYINELKGLDDKGLEEKMEALASEVKSLKDL